MGFDFEEMLESASSSRTEETNLEENENFDEEMISKEDYDDEYYDDDEEDYYEEDEEYDQEDELKSLINEIRDTKKKLDVEVEAAEAKKKYYEKKNKKKPRGLFDASIDPEMRDKPLLDKLGYDRDAKLNKKPSKVEKIIDKILKNPKVRVAFYALVGLAGLALGIIAKFFIK